MTTKAAFDSKAPDGIIAHARDLFGKLGQQRVMVAIVEISERTEPSDFEADSKVKLRVIEAELAPDDDMADAIKETLRTWYKRRTNAGTFDEILDDEAPPAVARQLTELEAARPDDVVDAEIIDPDNEDDEADDQGLEDAQADEPEPANA